MSQICLAIASIYMYLQVLIIMALDLETHEFMIPKKEVSLPADIATKWEKSEVRG